MAVLLVLTASCGRSPWTVEVVPTSATDLRAIGLTVAGEDVYALGRVLPDQVGVVLVGADDATSWRELPSATFDVTEPPVVTDDGSVVVGSGLALPGEGLWSLRDEQWQDIPVPVEGFTITDLAVDQDGALLVASAVNVHRTSDRGETWATSEPPGPGVHMTLAVLEDGSLVAGGTCFGGAEDDDDPCAWRSDDGEAWTSVPLDGAASDASEIGVPGVASLGGEELVMLAAGAEATLVWRSTDGGRSWTRLDDLATTAELQGVAASPNGTVITVAPPGRGAGPVAYVSSDRGESWVAHTLPLPDGFGGAGNGADVSFTSAGDALVLGSVANAHENRLALWRLTSG